jgi:hypothetical protein
MFFAMLILMFVFMRLTVGRRHRFARLRCYNHHYGHRPVRIPQPAPEPTPFERLKQRYVDGDLSDEQYEDELDKLLRSGTAVSFDSGSTRAGTSARLI